MQQVLKGILFGLFMATFIGPVFFSLIQTTIQNGKKAGITMALGIFLGDSFYVVLSLLGFTSFVSGPDDLPKWLSVLGALVMAAFGLTMIFRKPTITLHGDHRPSRSWYRDLFKGLLLNVVNPATCIFWVGAVVAYAPTETGGFYNSIRFFGGSLATILTTDILKVYTAERLSRAISPKVMLWISRGTGLLLLGWATWFLIK